MPRWPQLRLSLVMFVREAALNVLAAPAKVLLRITRANDRQVENHTNHRGKIEQNESITTTAMKLSTIVLNELNNPQLNN